MTVLKEIIRGQVMEVVRVEELERKLKGLFEKYGIEMDIVSWIREEA